MMYFFFAVLMSLTGVNMNASTTAVEVSPSEYETQTYRNEDGASQTDNQSEADHNGQSQTGRG